MSAFRSSRRLIRGWTALGLFALLTAVCFHSGVEGKTLPSPYYMADGDVNYFPIGATLEVAALQSADREGRALRGDDPLPPPQLP